MEVLASIRFLGPLAASVQGRAVDLGGTRPRTVLAVLLLAEGGYVSVERLLDVLWEEDPPNTARAQVLIHISALRRAFGLDVIETMKGGYRIRRESVWVDGYAALALQERGDAEALSEAMSLWRGPVLACLSCQALAPEVRRWEDLRLGIAQEWAEDRLAAAATLDVIDVLTLLVVENPLIETLRALLMTALWRAGRRAAALEAYQEGRRVLVEELGLEPGQGLREVHEQILAEEPADVRAQPSPAQLPPSTPAFTGRDEQVGVLDLLLERQRRDLPVVVISGVAGVGKSALALHWAHRVAQQYNDGQLFANLYGYDAANRPATAHQILRRFLRALDVPGEEIPADVDECSALYRSLLQGRRMLIVLDNAASADQVRPLLPGSASCFVVVTARRRLEELVADGATAIAVKVMTDRESVQLLSAVIDRPLDAVTAARVGRLCDGLPLALRIVAARLASRPGWSLEEMAGRLSDERSRLDQLSRSTRHVRGTLTLSYEELSAKQRTAFVRLATFSTPAGAAAWLMAALMDCSLREADDLLEELVDAQLLQPYGRDRAGQLRYQCHDLIRLFALEQARAELTPEERKQAYDRVIGALLAVAERTDRQVQGAFTQGLRRGNAPRWLPADIDHMVTDSANWIEAEGLTFSAAVCLAVEMGWDEPAWELISSVELLNMHAGFSPARVAEIETVVEVCRQNGNRHGEAMMLRTLATAFTATDQLGAARTRFEQAAAIVDELDDDFGRAMCHGGLGLVDMLQGNLDDALERLELCRALCEQIGNPTKAADTMARMAGLHLQRDLPDEALRLAKDGLSALPTGDPTTSTVEGNLLRVLAEAAGKLGLHQEALEASTRSVTLARQIGHLLLEALALRSRGEARIALGSPADGLADLQLALQLALRIRDRWVEGRVLLTLAEAEPERAISHLETAATIFAEIGTPVWHERTLTALNAARTRR